MKRRTISDVQTTLLSRPSATAQVAETLRKSAHWALIASELDAEFGTEAVEASMRAAGADPDAYLASRAALYAGWDA